ncbi:MAG: hypothetical protein HFJ09_00705 [Lachnospiraceae bacterium]|nr:hypothetical protein [Lachnospiraceae bacterium]
MRNYIKIFSITISIQIVAVALGFVLAFDSGRGYSALPMLIVVGYVISLITDIYLAVKIDTIWYKKMIYIFLMPTNYTPIGLLWFAMYCLGKFFEMLPPNLG